MFDGSETRPLLVTAQREFPFVDALHKGYWEENGIAVCERNGVSIDFAARGRPPFSVRVREGLELFSGMPSNSSKGFERLYGRQLYAVRDLEDREHTLRICVTGEAFRCDPDRSFMGVSADNCYVSVDRFVLTDGLYDGGVRMYLNDEYNFGDLSWGCLEKKPVVVDTGYRGGVRVKLGKTETIGEGDYGR